MSATADEVRSRGCARPIKLSSGIWVRCGSRVKSLCESCAELYRLDWAAIARSGVFDGPIEQFKFYLLTLTAPSFGAVHRVPKSGKALQCKCGATHSPEDAGLRGVPLDKTSYDYSGQVAWNRDNGILWTNTVRRIRDRWDSFEFFLVREWQDRGVLHLHVIVRISRHEAPSPEALKEVARSATATSKIDGVITEWGTQAKCDAFRADGDGAKTIWYLSKALNYVLKDVVLDAGDDSPEAWRHLARLDQAAKEMRCKPDCTRINCSSKVHQRFGARSHVVSASRRTSKRSGWSFSGLTRTVQRRLRLEWWLAQSSEPQASQDKRPSVRAAVGVAATASPPPFTPGTTT